ncbi:uncharacterized protein A4U43_C02F18800 [Asparagus officinalis]|uniref:Uncharacterized protein n=1 Tax=Asparagus officinalis TaxID=4686 RepID=A0A5P1FK02_ASPOF|nr:uncharacterized protein A4U43_C02F18800 [Asparagus officinalis]
MPSLTQRRRRREGEGLIQPRGEETRVALVPLDDPQEDPALRELGEAFLGERIEEFKPPRVPPRPGRRRLKWDQLRSCIIGHPSPTSQYAREPRARAIDQFRLPEDEKLIRRILDRGLHQALRSYFLQGALLENELFNRVDHLWTSHQDLLDEVDLLRSNEKVPPQQTADGSASDVSQVAKLRQELNEMLQERDHTEVLARVEKAATAHAKHQLDTMEVIITQLQEEIKQLKSKPLQKVIDEHRQEILDSYRDEGESPEDADEEPTTTLPLAGGGTETPVMPDPSANVCIQGQEGATFSDAAAPPLEDLVGQEK